MKKKGLHVYYPYVDKSMVPNNRFGKLYNHNVPILAVIGTSSRQGKFTLQLTLREKFIKDGYRVGQLGTEPSSLLFNFDDVYPVGYDSTVYITNYDSIVTVNDKIASIDKDDTEIIIVGTQSHTIHPSTRNAAFLPLYNHEILLAADPDGVILCVNIEDEIAYVERTINFIENYLFCKVFSIVVFPVIKDLSWSILGIRKGKKDIEKLKKYSYEIANYFNLPVFTLGESNEMDALYNKCIDYLS